VHTDLLDPGTESVMGHIELARWADLVLVAPATADFMARLACGMADDLLTTLCLATTAPLVLVPAMNQQMWQAPATQGNKAVLVQRGIRFVGPAEGDQACGEFGPGRMVEPAQIVDALSAAFATGELTGRRVLVTAGPTREAIDPVRYISNRSSGKMGYAIARAAAEAGAAVTLISGPVSLAAPDGVNCVTVESAAEMADAVLKHVAECDIFIAAAAVADYRCASPARRKIKKSDAEWILTLAATTDILARVASMEGRRFTVGFAAETENLAAHARQKLQAKRLDMIAANEVGVALGFESDENALHVFWADGEVALPRTSKAALARQLITLIANRYREKHPT
jgi:phosphopantothenoylcysteine decarboxylase/phosphopantothenate--cysteine ligase